MTKRDEPPSDKSADCPSASASSGAIDASISQKWQNLLHTHRWIPLVVPLVVYLGLGSLEPKPPEPPVVVNVVVEGKFGQETVVRKVGEPESREFWRDYSNYPAIYMIRIAITIAVMVLVSSGYREFPFRFTWASTVVGAVGGVLWVWICRLDLEEMFLKPIGLGYFLATGERRAFDPYEMLGDNLPWMVFFILVRMAGLAVIVPVIEEFFLRGFFMRYMMDFRWWKVPFGEADRMAIASATIYGLLTHPSEAFAAIIWFSLITWWMLRTRNIWDCVVAHGVTNLTMGIYVLVWKDWTLW